MAQSKNYYVSIVAGRLDIGLTIEAPNEYMAAIYGLEVLTDDYDLERCDITITGVEEERDD